jgi:hypothetical protein
MRSAQGSDSTDNWSGLFSLSMSLNRVRSSAGWCPRACPGSTPSRPETSPGPGCSVPHLRVTGMTRALTRPHEGPSRTVWTGRKSSPAPRDGRWKELAKDGAAMADARGGLILFRVRDTTGSPSSALLTSAVNSAPEQGCSVAHHTRPSGRISAAVTPDHAGPPVSASRLEYTETRAPGRCGRSGTDRPVRPVPACRPQCAPPRPARSARRPPVRHP